MRVVDQIASLKAKRQELVKTKINIKNSLSDSPVCYDKDTCPFCGSMRVQIRTIAGRTAYKQCDCEENQKAMTFWNTLLVQETECADQLEQIEREIGKYEVMCRNLTAQSNLGRRFTSRTFKTFHIDGQGLEKAYQIAKKYAEDFEANAGNGILFTGPPGTGKTHLAAAITNYIIEEYGIPVKFGGFVDILDNVKQSFKTDESVVSELVNVPLLVIDDLGKERKTEWSNSILYQVINSRYENYLPVIITTNEDMGDLERKIGEATLSRLIEMCQGIKLNGKDYRKERLI